MAFPDRIERAMDIAHPSAKLIWTGGPTADRPEDAHDKAFHGNTEGWASELGELVSYLDAAA